MKTALLLILCWLLALIPLDQGLTPLVTLLFNPDRTLYGTAQLTGFAGILLTLYLANLGVEVVLRRRFQIAGMLALLAAWIDFINSSGTHSSLLWLCLLALPFHLLGLLILVRGIQAFGRQKTNPDDLA
ncbi:MAG: hypothetical protein ACRDBT_00540 [Aeromonas sp.]